MPDHNSYNKYSGFSNLSYNIISHLILNSEADNLWKLLKYSSNDALTKFNLTKAEKAALIYKGQEPSTPYKVLTTQFLDDASDERDTQLRIYTGTIYPENYVQGIIDFRMDLICNNKIAVLSNSQNRLDVMFECIMKSLNGRDIEGLGNLYFNADRRKTNSSGFFNPNKFYVGRAIVMSTNYAG